MTEEEMSEVTHERERFEEWCWEWYLEIAKEHDLKAIEKDELFRCEGNRYYQEVEMITGAHGKPVPR